MLPIEKIDPVAARGNTVCLINVGNRWLIGQADRNRTSPHWEKFYENRKQVKYTRHAEAHALQLADRIGGKIKKLIVLRFRKDGTITMAKPCFHCQEMLKEHGIPFKIVYYSDDKGEIQCLQ